MLFLSLPFLAFFIAFFVLYWLVFGANSKIQNILILIGCYVFYGWSDWRFLLLLIGSSFVNYHLGLLIAGAGNARLKKALLYTGIFFSVGLLLYFKYTNFFIQSFIDAFAAFHVKLNIHTISLILP